MSLPSLSPSILYSFPQAMLRFLSSWLSCMNFCVWLFFTQQNSGDICPCRYQSLKKNCCVAFQCPINHSLSILLLLVFQSLAVINQAVLNTLFYMSSDGTHVLISFLFVVSLGVELLSHRIQHIQLQQLQTLSDWSYHFTLPPAVNESFSCSVSWYLPSW